MKLTRILAPILCVLAAVTGAMAQGSPNAPLNSSGGSALSFVGGRFYANEYSSNSGLFSAASVYTGNAATGSASITIRGGYIVLKDGRSVMPWAINVPLVVSDATPELVTPTAVSGCYNSKGMNQDGVLVTCTITASFTFVHGVGASILSATGGVAEAEQDAYNQGGGTVVIGPGWTLNTSCTSCYTSMTNMFANLPTVPNVQFNDVRQNNIPYWTDQANGTTALATPTTRVGGSTCTGSNTVCDTSIAVASGGFTNAAQYVWVAYVDQLGGIGKASLTANYTTAGAVQIEFLAPAASAGAVGWIFGIGTSYAAAYWIPATSTNCTLTTIETVVPACAVTNTNFNQTGSNAFVAKPLTTFALYPIPGGVAAAYNPNFLSHTTFAYQPSALPSLGFPSEYGPFTATAALTAGQLGVLGTIPLPTGYLNWIGRELEIHGKFNYTPTTGGTAPEVLVEIGDITDFSTGTPKALCTELEVHTTTTATYDVDFTCTLQTQATGTTGTIQPGGFLVDGISTGATLAIAAPEQDSGPITADVLDTDLLYIVFAQTTSAETTGPQLQKVDLTVKQ
jgi:hypothetical protein